MTTRHYFRWKHSTISSAVQTGKKIELCYSPGLVSSDPVARRNLIQNAGDLIRRTRGAKGLIISSEAQSALGTRGPWDVINLAAVWGLSQEHGYEAVSTEARKCVNAAKLKRSSYRGAIDVIYGGARPATPAQKKKGEGAGHKRKGQESRDNGKELVSKKQKTAPESMENVQIQDGHTPEPPPNAVAPEDPP